MREAIVLVHGVWSIGFDLLRLRHRLTMAGYDCYVFNYHIWGKPPAKIARRLHTFVETIDAPVVHFVAHSFGGIVLLHMYDQFLCVSKGRIVLMGSPVNGSAVGQRIIENPVTRWMLGQSYINGLSGDVPVWKGWQDIGVIAGDFPVGLGLVAGSLSTPHDGIVSVEETELKGATDAIIMPVSHLGMLISKTVSKQIVIFLRTGKFDQETTTPILDVGLA